MNSSKETETKADYLDLPDAPDFVSEPPFIPLAEMIKLCEEMLPVWNKRRFEEEEPLPMIFEYFYL